MGYGGGEVIVDGGAACLGFLDLACDVFVGGWMLVFEAEVFEFGLDGIESETVGEGCIYI